MSSSNRLVLSTNVCGTKLQHVCAFQKTTDFPKRSRRPKHSRHVCDFCCFAALPSSVHLSSCNRRRSPLSLPAGAAADAAYLCALPLHHPMSWTGLRESLHLSPPSERTSYIRTCPVVFFFVIRKIGWRVCAGFLCLALLSDSSAIDLLWLKLHSDFDTCVSTFSSCL